MTRYFAIINPRSGGGRTEKRFPLFKRLLGERIGDFDYAFTKGPREATELTRKAIKEGYGNIVSIGGDGTHHEVINGFFENERAIDPNAIFYPITSGTGSDYTRNLREQGLIAEPFSIFESDRIIAVDLGYYTCIDEAARPTSGYFINILDFGFTSEVVDLVNRSSKFFGGFLSFFIGGLRTFVSYRQKPTSIGWDDFPAKIVNNYMGIVAKGRYFGGGLKIAPYAELSNGMFDLICFNDFGRNDLLRNVVSFYRGDYEARRLANRQQTKNIKVSSSDRIPVEADGEVIGYLPLSVTILDKILKLKIS